MKKISISQLVALPDKNQQEAERMLDSFNRHINDLNLEKDNHKIDSARQEINNILSET